MKKTQTKMIILNKKLRTNNTFIIIEQNNSIGFRILIPVYLFEGNTLSLQLQRTPGRCLHDTGSSFMQVRLHPGFILSK